MTIRIDFKPRVLSAISCRRTGALLCLAFVVSFAPFARANEPSGGIPPLRFVEQPTPFVTTLMMHQVDNHPIVSANGEDHVFKPWVSPAQLDEFLSAAEARGYHVVSLDAALAVLTHHAPASSLPLKPLLLTFDDGFASAWIYATPILRKHHAVATMFFEGIQTDTNVDRLTRTQLRAMAASGTWTLESHGYHGHSNVTLDAAGNENPYWYANLAWLKDRHRRETYAEYETRMRADFRQFRRTFESVAGAPIDVFAYPSGEFGQNPPPPAGTDPAKADDDAGHSNVAGLKSYLFDALRKEGYRAAFAVSLVDVDRPASPIDDPLAFPRLGVGSDFKLAELDSLQSPGIDLPADAVDGLYADCGPVAVTPDRIWTASTSRPEIFALSHDGRVLAHWRIDALMADRKGQSSLISGLIVHGSQLWLVQQAGTWPGATAQFTRLQIDGADVRIIERRPLPEAASWLVGMAEIGGKLFGLNDAGEVYELATGTLIYTVPLAAGADRQDRFTGPLVVANRLLAYDTKANTFVTLGPDDHEAIPWQIAGGTAHDFATLGDSLYVNVWNNDRHALAQYHVEGSLAPVAFRAEKPASEPAELEPLPGWLYASAMREPRFGNTLETLDAYRPMGLDTSARLRPYVGFQQNYESARSEELHDLHGGNYALAALGLQYTAPLGFRAFAQLGAAEPTNPIALQYTRFDMRTGLTFSSNWPFDDSERRGSYLSFFASTIYLSRYSNANLYTEVEAGRRLGPAHTRSEVFVRNTLTLDAKHIYGNNVSETSIGFRTYPLSRTGPSIAIEAVAGGYLSSPRYVRSFTRNYFTIRPTLSFGSAW